MIHLRDLIAVFGLALILLAPAPRPRPIRLSGPVRHVERN